MREGLLDDLARCGAAVLTMIRERALHRAPVPPEVGVVMIDDPAIAQLHGDYFADPSPTDVITFPYGIDGEIVISVETAERQGIEFGTSTEWELALYLVHGILHLCGYEDHSEAGRAAMGTLQDDLLKGSGFGE